MRRRDGLVLAFALIGCAPPVLPQVAVPAPPAASPVAVPASPAAPAVATTVPVAPAVPAPSSASSASTAHPSVATMALVKDVLAEQILAGAGAVTKTVLASPEMYRFQVLFTEVEGTTLVRHGYRADAEYYFPASSMKVPIALAAYERLAVLRQTQPGVDRDATMVIRPVTTGQGESYTTTLARETWRALIVSDNFSANRLLGFVGHREANETLWGLGLRSVRLRTGFATGAATDPPELSPQIDLSGPKGAATLPARKSTLRLPPTDATSLDIGKAYIDSGRRIEKPMSFADKNAVRLQDLQDALVRIVRPDLLPPDGTVTPDDLAYVKSALGTLPSASGLAGYDRNIVADYPLVPFLRGIERVRARTHVQIFSKVGQAFGFLIGNAYIVDKDTGRSFFLTASVFANPDGVMNNDVYGYDTISFPVLADVGEVFSRHVFGNATSAAK